MWKLAVTTFDEIAGRQWWQTAGLYLHFPGQQQQVRVFEYIHKWKPTLKWLCAFNPVNPVNPNHMHVVLPAGNALLRLYLFTQTSDLQPQLRLSYAPKKVQVPQHNPKKRDWHDSSAEGLREKFIVLTRRQQKFQGTINLHDRRLRSSCLSYPRYYSLHPVRHPRLISNAWGRQASRLSRESSGTRV